MRGESVRKLIETEEPWKPVHVDHFSRKVYELKDSSSKRKFPSILKVVKTALVLGHGNAEVERGLSESGKTVTDDGVCLSEVSISGIRTTSDGLKAFKGPCSVPITKQLLQLGCCAHTHHSVFRERAEEEEKGSKAAYSTERTSTANGSTERFTVRRLMVRKARESSARWNECSSHDQSCSKEDQ